MNDKTATEQFRNWVLVFHSKKDERWRDWIIKRLSLFKTPRPFVGKPTADGSIPRQITPVVSRDDDGAPSASLSDEDRETLRASRYLVVVCSPHAALSTRVDEAIRLFKSIGREHRIVCLIVSGEPYASSRLDPVGEECLPRSVKYEVNPQGELTDTPTAPFAADARPGKDGRHGAFLKLAARVLRIEFGELKQREHDRGQIQMTGVLAGSLLLLVFSAGFTVYSFGRTTSAERQIAEEKSAAEFARSEADKRNLDINRQTLALAQLNLRLAETLQQTGDDQSALAHLAAAFQIAPDDQGIQALLISSLAKTPHATPTGTGATEHLVIPNHTLVAVAEAAAGLYLGPDGRLHRLDDSRLRTLRDSIGSQKLNELVYTWATKAFELAESKTGSGKN